MKEPNDRFTASKAACRCLSPLVRLYVCLFLERDKRGGALLLQQQAARNRGAWQQLAAEASCSRQLQQLGAAASCSTELQETSAAERCSRVL